MSVFKLRDTQLSTNKMTVFTIAHSRQHIRTCSGAPWIRMTKRILDQHDTEKELLVTSAGMLHYDVPLRIWLRRGGLCRVILHSLLDMWPYSMKTKYLWLKSDPRIVLEEPSKQ
ncbi:hypothetical protein K8T06_10225 [bacterium]|nr:hypothetical protein [bacterium]